MFVILILFQLLACVTQGTEYAADLGLSCPDYFIAAEEPKKTKAWKQCQESSVELLGCLSNGHKVKDTADLADRTTILCDYLKSREHVVQYSMLFQKGRADVTKKYMKSKELKNYIVNLKEQFVHLTAKDMIVEEVSLMAEQSNVTVMDAKARYKERTVKFIRDISQLNKEYEEIVVKKSMNAMYKIEDIDLALYDKDPLLHKNNRDMGIVKLPKLKHVTTPDVRGIILEHGARQLTTQDPLEKLKESTRRIIKGKFRLQSPEGTLFFLIKTTSYSR